MLFVLTLFNISYNFIKFNLILVQIIKTLTYYGPIFYFFEKKLRKIFNITKLGLKKKYFIYLSLKLFVLELILLLFIFY